MAGPPWTSQETLWSFAYQPTSQKSVAKCCFPSGPVLSLTNRFLLWRLLEKNLPYRRVECFLVWSLSTMGSSLACIHALDNVSFSAASQLFPLRILLLRWARLLWLLCFKESRLGLLELQEGSWAYFMASLSLYVALPLWEWTNKTARYVQSIDFGMFHFQNVGSLFGPLKDPEWYLILNVFEKSVFKMFDAYSNLSNYLKFSVLILWWRCS